MGQGNVDRNRDSEEELVLFAVLRRSFRHQRETVSQAQVNSAQNAQTTKRHRRPPLPRNLRQQTE